MIELASTHARARALPTELRRRAIVVEGNFICLKSMLSRSRRAPATDRRAAPRSGLPSAHSLWQYPRDHIIFSIHARTACSTPVTTLFFPLAAGRRPVTGPAPQPDRAGAGGRPPPRAALLPPVRGANHQIKMYVYFNP